MTNPLAPVIDRFRLVSDAVRVTNRVLESGPDKSLTDHTKVVAGKLQTADFVSLPQWAVQPKHATLHALPQNDAANRLRLAITELEGLVVLELAAVFERTLRKHLTHAATTQFPATSADQLALRDAVTEKIERWEFKLLIDLFPSVDVIDPTLRMKAKQVVERRDWVAHGKHTDPNEKEPTNVGAEDAYQRLTDFLKAAGIVA